MSKKHKKQKQKPRFPWVIAAIGGVLLVAAAFLFANQSGDGGGTPSIAVDQQLIDYGDVKFNEEKTFAIKITNTGDGVLRFTEDPYIEILEGC
ncbi:MAG: hypothetical protein DPW21_00275 [Anaerolineae bacterium]|nr:hypothetical protein [Chloroflexi bacterium CFX2]MCQ3945117.1 hypothetical protein [Anaerolineae bacterium]MCZ7550886.1 DUF1573 domain-containing protein [Anaerolineales bacterium]GER79202.1 conserved hypothetical protein [Candidatus Denitrolinea symbiosum]